MLVLRHKRDTVAPTIWQPENSKAKRFSIYHNLLLFSAENGSGDQCERSKTKMWWGTQTGELSLIFLSAVCLLTCWVLFLDKLNIVWYYVIKQTNQPWTILLKHVNRINHAPQTCLGMSIGSFYITMIFN